MRRIAVVALSLSTIAAVAGVASAGAAAAASASAGPAGAGQPYSWSQSAVCPGTGLTLELRSSHTQIRSSGSGTDRQWSVEGSVIVTATGHRSSGYGVRYVGQDSPGGGTVVTGRSVQFPLGGGPLYVNGTAYLAPDGFLGRFTGSAVSVCTAMGG